MIGLLIIFLFNYFFYFTIERELNIGEYEPRIINQVSMKKKSSDGEIHFFY